MKQRLQHAIVIEALRSITRETLSKELDAALKDLTLPPNHRLHLLARSIAWHQKRQEPEPRLQELARELARLWQRVENNQEQQLYLLLISNLSLRYELDALHSSLQEEIKRLDKEYNARDSQRKAAQSKEEERIHRNAMRQQQQQRSVQETSRTLYQQVMDKVNELQPAQQQASWIEQVLQRVQDANAETTRPYELSDEERTHLRPQVRLLLALAAVQLIQTAKQRSTMREMIQQRTETEQAA
jgi:uncharacterized small protein (DUF1192 family)